MNRRQMLGASAAASAAAIVAPVVVAGAAPPSIPVTRKLLEGYNEWLFQEHRLLAMEMFPECPDPEGLVPQTGLGAGWHFRGPWSEWESLPKPSSRAALVMATVGAIDQSGRDWSVVRRSNSESCRPSPERMLRDYGGFLASELTVVRRELRAACGASDLDPLRPRLMLASAPALSRAPAVLAAVGL